MAVPTMLGLIRAANQAQKGQKSLDTFNKKCREDLALKKSYLDQHPIVSDLIISYLYGELDFASFRDALFEYRLWGTIKQQKIVVEFCPYAFEYETPTILVEVSLVKTPAHIKDAGDFCIKELWGDKSFYTSRIEGELIDPYNWLKQITNLPEFRRAA